MKRTKKNSLKDTLLVVDDEPANLQKLKRTFWADFDVTEAQSGEEALEILQQKRFNAIITDQRMPGISGVDLLRASLRASPDAVRIILTGYTEVEDLMDAINLGQVHRYVTKPWEPFSLKRTLIQDIEHTRLKRENQILNEQLRIAKEVQSTLLPQALPPVPHLQYFGICSQAREVGGDYYDFLQFEPEKLCIAVGDASGKGIGSALLMSTLQALLRSQALIYQDSLNDLVRSINHLLLERTQDDKFATLFLGLFDSNRHCLQYVNAGHCYPFLLPATGDASKVRFLGSSGTILGMFEDAEYEQRQVMVETGDLLVIYSDGLTEAANPSGEFFGERRLIETIAKHSRCSLKRIAQNTLEAVEGFSEETQGGDDRTLVLARVV